MPKKAISSKNLPSRFVKKGSMNFEGLEEEDEGDIMSLFDSGFNNPTEIEFNKC